MPSRTTHTLIAGLIDYAGLFPPASLSMKAAVKEYARRRQSPEAWLLGRFVVPADRLEEFDIAAEIDELTGVLNKAALKLRLSELILEARERRAQLSVLAKR